MSSTDDPRTALNLNPSQRLHLLSSCQYADKLLSEIENVLTASQSKSPFPKFKPDISPAPAKVVQDYIGRIRAQIVRILDSQGVKIPSPEIGSVHSIRVTLNFVDIAFEECRPKRMTGYGKISETARIELSGLVDEIQGIVSRLAAFLAQGRAADLRHRLELLETAGNDVSIIRSLERIIDRYGMVEFRPALAGIIERMESNGFEIAVFGRVSSGKSSLLNYIVGMQILPVGVNPITAVPTRIVFGSDARATVSFADRNPERVSIERIGEFATEQQNPGNIRHVTKIVAELPAARLREGIVYVDTPGLGSLATSGAAETRAYLPRCDLGVVLIDAGSTLTQDDLATIQNLQEAGIPASVLLSKADLLAPADCERCKEYASQHLRSDLGLDLPVHPVSIKGGYSELLENWLTTEILPLYERHGELARQSLKRKIGSLRLALAAALRVHQKRQEPSLQIDPNRVRVLETELRTVSGQVAEARSRCMDLADLLRLGAGDFIAAAVAKDGDGTIRAKLEMAVADEAGEIASITAAVAQKADGVLTDTGKALHFESRPESGELTEVLTSMPRFDLGTLELQVSAGWIPSLLGKRSARWSVGRQVRSRAGKEIEDAITIYSRVLQAWVRKTFSDLQHRFDTYADAYRAQLGRLTSGDSSATADDRELSEDLAVLAGPEQVPDAAA